MSLGISIVVSIEFSPILREMPTPRRRIIGATTVDHLVFDRSLFDSPTFD